MCYCYIIVFGISSRRGCGLVLGVAVTLRYEVVYWIMQSLIINYLGCFYIVILRYVIDIVR